jgi:DNA invertase Pin-like site-specific DNA recombinase
MIAVYTRVSTEHQEKKYSPIAQKQAGIVFAKQQGQEYELYEETGSGAEICLRVEGRKAALDCRPGASQYHQGLVPRIC